MIIDGKSLTYALEDDIKNKFLELAIGCASVICCRSSPRQKALVSSYSVSGNSLYNFIQIYFLITLMKCCVPFFKDNLVK